MRIGTIDIGTNSVLLLVADADERGRLSPVVDRSTITRLGQGVDRTRTLHPEAVDRTLACLEQYARQMRELGVEAVDAVCTSAARDAGGAEEFVAEAAALLGARPRVIAGKEEARLTFVGALAGLSVQGPVLVCDIGGGSTELVTGVVGPNGGTQIEASTSLDIGAVRLTERHIQTDPPSASELRALAHATDTALRAFALGGSDGRTCVGIAGTITTLAAVDLGLEPYDGARVHGHRLGRVQLEALIEKLAAMPLQERRSVWGLEPKRADVIVAGAIVARRVLAAAGAEHWIVSDRGVRWGLAIELAGQRLKNPLSNS